jgi:hypothetical protein
MQPEVVTKVMTTAASILVRVPVMGPSDGWVGPP